MKMVIMTIVWAIRINTVSYFLTPLSNPQLRGLASSPWNSNNSGVARPFEATVISWKGAWFRSHRLTTYHP